MTGPAPRARYYVGFREPGAIGPARVDKCDKVNDYVALDPRFDLANHSPDGFQWGYPGSGPAQLALALVADATGDDELAMRTYQRFKSEIVVGLPDRWILEAGNIADFALSLDKTPVERSL